MARITVNAKIDAILARLDRVGDKMDRHLLTEVSNSAFAISADAKSRAPVKTGLLQRSIGVRFEEDGRRAVIGTPVFYARFQKPPFLQPAFRSERTKLLRRLSKRLDEVVR